LSGFEAVHLDAHEAQQQHSQQHQYHHSRALSQDRGSSGSPKSAASRGSGSGGTSSSTSKQGLGVGDNSSSSQASGSPRIAAAGECGDTEGNFSRLVGSLYAAGPALRCEPSRLVGQLAAT
jgi:hypothetical protein